MEFTNEQLTDIYKKSNGEVGKARPLTTDSIFTAMRAIAELVEQATLERAAKVCEEISDEYARTESRRYPELKTDAETGASDCEDAIRALKTQGE
jgi:hypothetical protein